MSGFKARRTLALILLLMIALIGVGFFLFYRTNTFEIFLKSRINHALSENDSPLKLKTLKYDSKQKTLDLVLENSNTHQTIIVHTGIDYTFHFNSVDVTLNPEITATPLPKILGKLTATIDFKSKANFDVDHVSSRFNFYFSEPLKHIVHLKTAALDGTLEYTAQTGLIHGPIFFHARELLFESEGKQWSENEIELQANMNVQKSSSETNVTGTAFTLTKPYLMQATLTGTTAAFSAPLTFRAPLETLLNKTLPAIKAKGPFEIAGKAAYSKEHSFSFEGTVKTSSKTAQFNQMKLENASFSSSLYFPVKPMQGSFAFKKLATDFFQTEPASFSIYTSEQSVEIELNQALVSPAFGSRFEIPDFYLSIPFHESLSRSEILFALNGGPFNLSSLQKAFCFMPDQKIEGTLNVNYPDVYNDENGLRLEGESTLTALGGITKVQTIDYIWSAKPARVRFSAQWNDLDLHQIGELTRFGDMRGSLDGSLTDAEYSLTNLGPVPMQYDFTLQGKKRSGKDISFYGRAVNNILELVGSRKQEMPWFAQWGMNASITFRNWFPMTADYMGLRAKSVGGWTELYTFDPPHAKNHYLLFGSAFKIPLNTYGIYPAVMRTDAFQGWLWGMLDYFKKMNQEKKDVSTSAQDKPKCIPFWEQSS